MRLFVVALICRSISFRLVNAIWRDWPAHVFFVQINKNSNLITVLVLTKLSIVQKKKNINSCEKTTETRSNKRNNCDDNEKASGNQTTC